MAFSKQTESLSDVARQLTRGPNPDAILAYELIYTALGSGPAAPKKSGSPGMTEAFNQRENS
jgi:hypothetical protein